MELGRDLAVHNVVVVAGIPLRVQLPIGSTVAVAPFRLLRFPSSAELNLVRIKNAPYEGYLPTFRLVP